MKLSLCMIVKNEEETLKRCLDSVKALIDEIIIVDTGSNDKTKEIAKKYTDKIYDFEWVDDFSLARNFAFSKATKEYIMWLDADDVLEKSDLDKLLTFKKDLSPLVDVVMLPYHISFDVGGNPTFSFYRERIVKNDGTFIWRDPIHETITPHGKIIYFDAGICHKKIKPTPAKRNLEIYEKIIASNTPLSARQKFYYSRELYFNQYYEKAIASFIDYLENYHGWLENNIEACLNLADCYLQTNRQHEALKWLYYSFIFDIPRAEIISKIGEIYMNQKKYELAIYWFLKALQCEKKLKSGGFVLSDEYDFIPYLLLCVCYFYKNNMEQALYYHKNTSKLKPSHPSVIYNQKVFKEWKSNIKKQISK